jgi:hypothetical protein
MPATVLFLPNYNFIRSNSGSWRVLAIVASFEGPLFALIAAMNHQHSYTEEELIDLLKGDDEAAYVYLYDQYAPALLGVITRMILDKERANRLLVDVFIAIRQRIGDYDPAKSRLLPWMAVVTKEVVTGAN